MQALVHPTRRRWVFLAFLASLHLVFMQGPESGLGRLLFLTHIGIGLLWQPFVHPGRKVGFGGTALVVCAAALLALYLSWPLLLVWTFLLTGVVGGKVFLFPGRWERLFHLFALGYLATVLLALVIPHLLSSLGDETVVDAAVLYATPLIFLLMLLLPVERASAEGHAEFVDYVYGVLVFLLLATIALGSVSFSLLVKAGYIESLLVTLGTVAGILLLLGFIWNPRSGFGGVGGAVAQHIASLGLPVEAWLESLALLAREEPDAERFVARAAAELPQRLPGVVGGRWRTPAGAGDFGEAMRETRGETIAFEYERLRLELVCRVAPSPSLRWHHELTARLLAEFYMGKWRAAELQRLTYVEAIHETGARVTHDVKNLLQSLDTLCAAAAQEAEAPSPRFGALLRRQLPEIADRLRQTLGKLNAPKTQEITPARQPAGEWLRSLANRYPGEWLTLAQEGSGEAMIDDAELFSSVADNLLQNAADKRRMAPALAVRCTLVASGDRVESLQVEDDGEAIPAALAGRLMAQRVASENGLGVGLYQSARFAAERGWRLALEENRDGCVRFVLRQAGSPSVPRPR